jgi:succinate-semialdehyde dehydrogenase/glutarate-semialdehyde dehydrogenase
VGFSLELGGKYSMYVAADADIPRAVAGAVRACFASAGQLCISAERLIVHRDVHGEFVTRFVEAVEAMKLGTALEYGYDMGSLVGRDQLDTVTEHVEDARARGAIVLTGGRPRPDVGPFAYEPTVLTGVTAEMTCRDSETFGPVVSLYEVGSDEEAIALANDTEYGLNASVWTRDVRRGRRIAAQIQTGTVNINDGYAAAWASVGAPMGGMKASGIGRRHGREGIVKYTESQNVTAQHLVGFGGLPGVPQDRYARGMTLALVAMKRLGLK